jgi:hypothetical protein
MNEDERIALKNEIGELITEINESRSVVPKKKLKYLRKSLREMSEGIFTTDETELEEELGKAFQKLASVKSKNKNLVKAQNHAFELWKNFPHYQNNHKTGEPMGK